MKEEILSKSKIADKLGTNPMRVSRFIERRNITPVKKEGKRELYNLTDFNALKKEIENPEAQAEAKNHGFSKDELILTLKKQLEEQKQQYEELVAAKDETIASLKETIKTSDKAYEDMKAQLAIKDKQIAVKDGQIASLTTLTTNAQTLNLLDKPKQDKEEKSNSEINVKKERENVVEEKLKKHHWWQFRK